MATARVYDFAGHPSFQCRGGNLVVFNYACHNLIYSDQKIPPLASVEGSTLNAVTFVHGNENDAPSCDCLHPCDLNSKADPVDDPENSSRWGVSPSRKIAFTPHKALESETTPYYDFFAAQDNFDRNCQLRELRCSQERAKRRGGDSEHPAFPMGATRARTVSIPGEKTIHRAAVEDKEWRRRVRASRSGGKIAGSED